MYIVQGIGGAQCSYARPDLWAEQTWTLRTMDNVVIRNRSFFLNNNKINKTLSRCRRRRRHRWWCHWIWVRQYDINDCGVIERWNLIQWQRRLVLRLVRNAGVDQRFIAKQWVMLGEKRPKANERQRFYRFVCNQNQRKETEVGVICFHFFVFGDSGRQSDRTNVTTGLFWVHILSATPLTIDDYGLWIILYAVVWVNIETEHRCSFFLLTLSEAFKRTIRFCETNGKSAEWICPLR